MRHSVVSLGFAVCLVSTLAAHAGESDMTIDALEQELTAVLEARDTGRFMRLVSPDIACLDGSDYETVKRKRRLFERHGEPG